MREGFGMKRVGTMLILLALLLTSFLHAEVLITTASYQKIYDKSSKKRKWVRAKKVVPGNIVRYINTVTNQESETAEKLTVINNIPEHMEYVKGSARCRGRCKIIFSVDGGRHFATPRKLYVKDRRTKRRRRARANEYTTIKWIISRLGAGKRTTVEFKARLK